MKHKVVVTTIVEIDDKPTMFTVSGETDRNPYRLARSLNDTNDGDLVNWSTEQIVSKQVPA